MPRKGSKMNAATGKYDAPHCETSAPNSKTCATGATEAAPKKPRTTKSSHRAPKSETLHDDEPRSVESSSPTPSDKDFVADEKTQVKDDTPVATSASTSTSASAASKATPNKSKTPSKTAATTTMGTTTTTSPTKKSITSAHVLTVSPAQRAPAVSSSKVGEPSSSSSTPSSSGTAVFVLATGETPLPGCMGVMDGTCESRIFSAKSGNFPFASGNFYKMLLVAGIANPKYPHSRSFDKVRHVEMCPDFVVAAPTVAMLKASTAIHERVYFVLLAYVKDVGEVKSGAQTSVRNLEVLFKNQASALVSMNISLWGEHTNLQINKDEVVLFDGLAAKEFFATVTLQFSNKGRILAALPTKQAAALQLEGKAHVAKEDDF